jgi:hypothetical protein
MFSNVGMGELILLPLLALVMGLIPIALAIWVVLTLSRMQRSIDRIAAAVERLVTVPHRGP